MNAGGMVVLELDFGRGHMTIGVHTASAPAAPSPADIGRVIHMGADITDQLTEQELETIRAEWRLQQ